MRFADSLGRFGMEVIMDKLHDDNGYVNLLRELDTPQGDRPAHLSITLLRQAAGRIPQVGLSLTSDLEDAEAEVARWQHAAEQAEARAADAEAKLERINGVVKSGEFKIVRQQGRPPAKKVSA